MKTTIIAGLSLMASLSVLSMQGQRLMTVPEVWSSPTSMEIDASSTHIQRVEISEEMKLQTGMAMIPGANMNQRKATVRRAGADDFLGEWVQINTSVYDGTQNTPVITVEKTGDNYTVTGLYLSDSKVKATYNATSGMLEIAPQVIYNHESYGKCGLHTFTVQGTKVVMDETSPITMQIANDGTLQMSAWGLFVEAGSYKGSAFDAFYTSEGGHPNGMFKTTPFDASESPINASVWIRQVNEGEVVVANMLGNSRPLSISLDTSGAYIMSQYVMSASLYGDFYLFAATSAGKIDKNNYITVAAMDSGYNVGAWGVYCLASTTIYAATGKTSELVTDFKFTYPTIGENTMVGSGSADDPWIVRTAEHLRYIALTTTKENSYAGKNFKLGANIDLSQFKGHWYPIGGSQSAPFQGCFDGDGKQITGLTQAFSGAMGAGLFGFTGASSTLKNINLTNISYSGNGKYIGGLVGYAEGPILNCRVQGEIEAINNEIGGVAGYSTSEISGCEFNGNLYGGIDIGGIVGYTKGTLSKCRSVAYIYLNTHVPYSLTSTHALGGIAAAGYGTDAKPVTITDCEVSGIVADLKASDHIGGIMGYCYAVKISRCLSNALVVSTATTAVDGGSPAAGGIAGYISKGSVEDCIIAGAVNAAGTTFAGGIAGYGGGASSYAVAYRRNIVTGMINTASEWDKVSVTGSHFDKALGVLSIENCYYDRQSTGLDSIAIGHKSTNELTSGKLPEGFSSDIWVAQEGLYPTLELEGGWYNIEN